MSLKPTFKLVLADAQPVILAVLRAALGAESCFEIVGEACDGPETLRLCAQLTPDLVVLDARLPGLGGVQVARRVLEACGGCRILVFAAHEDHHALIELLEAGVSGYLLKRAAVPEIVRALAIVAAGGLYVDPAVSDPPALAAAAHSDAALSPRELAAIKLTAQGHSNKSVAAELGVGVKSAETYKARAMEKLGVRTRVDIVKLAVSQGWLAG